MRKTDNGVPDPRRRRRRPSLANGGQHWPALSPPDPWGILLRSTVPPPGRRGGLLDILVALTTLRRAFIDVSGADLLALVIGAECVVLVADCYRTGRVLPL